MILEIWTDGQSDYQRYQIASFHSWKRGSLMYTAQVSKWLVLLIAQYPRILSVLISYAPWMVFCVFMFVFLLFPLLCILRKSKKKKKEQITAYVIEDRKDTTWREDFERGRGSAVPEERTSVRKRNRQKRELLHSGSVLSALTFRVFCVYDYIIH